MIRQNNGTDRSVQELLKDIGSNLEDIARSEIVLGRLAIKEEVIRTARASTSLGVGVVLSLYALGFLLLAAVYGLATQVAVWLAALIIGGAVGTTVFELDQPKVLEFNCRLGDPEAQAIVARMDFDITEVLADVASKRLDPAKLRWKSGASVCVVLTSGGYPGKFEIGKRIDGLTALRKNTGVEIFHAGTRRERDSLVTSGGRVLGLTAAADSLAAALGLAYGAAEKIHFDGMHYRKDIGAHVGRVKAAGD